MLCTCVTMSVLALAQAIAGTPAQWRARDLIGPDRAGALVVLFYDVAPGPSAHVDNCVEASRSFKGGVDVIVGCAMSISPEDFPKLLFSWGRPLSTRHVSAIQPKVEVPAVGPAFVVSDVYFLSPPELWDINDTLIYTNESRSRLVAYQWTQALH
jgi:hypothetical protein